MLPSQNFAGLSRLPRSLRHPYCHRVELRLASPHPAAGSSWGAVSLWNSVNWLRPRESNAVSLGYESRMVFRSTLPLVHNISRLFDVGKFFWCIARGSNSAAPGSGRFTVCWPSARPYDAHHGGRWRSRTPVPRGYTLVFRTSCRTIPAAPSKLGGNAAIRTRTARGLRQVSNLLV